MKKKFSISKKYLLNHYFIKNKSAQDIANILGCSCSTIYKAFSDYNIVSKSMRYYKHKFCGKLSSKYKDGRCLKKYYCKKCKTNKICYENYLYGSKLCKKCRGKIHSKLMKGKRNPNWTGGLNKNKYGNGFNNTLKNSIRNRDNSECQCCGLKQIIHIKKYTTKLDVHHIDYDKQNSAKTNLISLCKQCHIDSNFNRDYWYAFYTYLMEGKNG